MVMDKYVISSDVLELISSHLICPEKGGILGADDSNTVVAFCFDKNGVTERSTYFPNVEYLNQVIRDWYEKGIYFIGFAHSHPKTSIHLSAPDLYYANMIKELCNLNEVLMLLYIPQTHRFYQYVV